MFDHRELQTLISGARIPIDIQDLRQHTNYSGKLLFMLFLVFMKQELDIIA